MPIYYWEYKYKYSALHINWTINQSNQNDQIRTSDSSRCKDSITKVQERYYSTTSTAFGFLNWQRWTTMLCRCVYEYPFLLSFVVVCGCSVMDWAMFACSRRASLIRNLFVWVEWVVFVSKINCSALTRHYCTYCTKHATKDLARIFLLLPWSTMLYSMAFRFEKHKINLTK